MKGKRRKGQSAVESTERESTAQVRYSSRRMGLWVVKGLVHYWLGRHLFRRGERRWVLAQWQFLMAVNYFERSQCGLSSCHSLKAHKSGLGEILLAGHILERVSAQFIADAEQYLARIYHEQEESLREFRKEQEHRRFCSIAAMRYRRLMEESAGGDSRKLNLSLFLTYPG
jgi:hypothetical protein